MVKYSNGTARCPECGRTIRYGQNHKQHDHYEPYKNQNSGGAGWLIVSFILFGIASFIPGFWYLGLFLFAVAGLILFFEYLEYIGKL